MEVRELLDKVYNGEIVLPDFQRSFIWYPEDVRELIVSVLGGYFVGSMLTIGPISKEESPFALRLIEGVKEVNEDAKVKPVVTILLDGQQRTTALFYALYEPDIPLKDRKYPHRFFVDLKKALEGNWDDAVIAVSVADKTRLNKISKGQEIIPLSLFRNSKELTKKFKDHPRFEEIYDLAHDFLSRKLHIVNLSWENSDDGIEKIVETFERINRTGVPLSVFDLLTAKLYKHEINLRDLLENFRKRYSFLKDDKMDPIFVLKVIALMRGKEPKRKNILGLEANSFIEDWETACKSLEYAYQRYLDTKDGYGVLDFKKWAPYSTMIAPLAAMIWYLKKNGIESKINYDKIDKWYWVSAFSNRYDQAVDSKSYSDFRAIVEWIETGKEPEFIKKFNSEDVNFDVDKQSSATYRAIMNLIVLRGAYDFKTGQPPQFERSKIQDDHIFPRSIFNENRILNRTLITTNQSKINKRPSEYFRERIMELGEKKVKEILESHLIPPEALDALLEDDLERFMELRKEAILDEIRRRTQWP